MKFMSKPRRKLLYDYVLSFVFGMLSIAVMLPFFVGIIKIINWMFELTIDINNLFAAGFIPIITAMLVFVPATATTLNSMREQKHDK